MATDRESACRRLHVGVDSEMRKQRNWFSGYTVQNVLSTIYHTLGIDPSLTFPNHVGRPVYLLEDREQVQVLL